jgi:hypothetical protein
MKQSIRAFVSTLAIGSLLLVGFAQPAQAVTCTSTSSWFYSVQTTILNPYEYGVKASNILVTGLEPCRQVRSLYVWNNDFDIVEVGWYRDGSSGDHADGCTVSTAPRVLVYQIRNGAVSCKPNTPILTGGQYYSFKVQNPDHNLSFHYFWGVGTIPDTALGPYVTDHTRGQAQISDEAFNAADNLRANYTGVNSLGSSAWHALPTAHLYDGPGNEDPYVVCSWGSTSLRVEPAGSC